MSSILARTKQIPTDSQYFVSIAGTRLNLSVFQEDPNQSTTSYVSGAAAGRFTSSNVDVSGFDPSGSLSLFRDMGKTILSSGRTFRAIQLLRLDGNTATLGGGGTGWTSTASGTPGVWKPSTNGVSGSASATSGQLSDFGVFYFETGAYGLGVAQGLVRYG